MPYEFGDVVLVAFPFTNQSATKQRPAAVISKRDYNDARQDIIIAAITSQLRQPAGFGELVLHDWKSAGLLKESVIKPVIATLARSLIKKRIGSLEGADRDALRSALHGYIG